MSDAAESALRIGWLPKAAAFFTTIDGGEIIMTLQGLAIYDHCGIYVVQPIHSKHVAAFEPGVKTMGYKQNRRTRAITYKFGVVNDGAYSSTVYYNHVPVPRQDVFDHPHYFLVQVPPNMAYLRPVHIKD